MQTFNLNEILNKNWSVMLLVAFSLAASWPIFMPGYFSHHDDLQVMRIYEMRRCFEDLQLPCRWVPDMGYGNGFPMFNYYSVLPYYIGGVLSFLFGFIGAAKLIFLIPLMLGGIAVYLLAKEFFGTLGGFLAGVLYIFAPYRALDIYVRGAVAESFGMSIAPLVFYFSYKLIHKNTLFNFLGACLSVFLFLISHNIMTLLFTPFFIIWILYWLIKENKQNLIPIFSSLILGFGMAAFFLLPAYFEKSLVQTENLIRHDLNFRAHFVTFNQLFLDRSFEYGSSVLGPNDTISFQLGWPHWWMALAAFLILCLVIANKIFKFNLMNRIPVNFQQIFVIGFFTVIFFISTFMMHNKSAFVWEQIGLLHYTQFPWRFLSLSILASSITGGSLILFFSKKWQMFFVLAVVIVTIILNFGYFKPKEFYPSLTDQQKLSGKLWDLQQRAGILDYLPQTAIEPHEPAPEKPLTLSGRTDIKHFENHSNYWTMQIDVSEPATMELPVFDFPKWTVIANGQGLNHNHENRLGRIKLYLEPGSYQIQGKLNDTPIRTASNIISLISLAVLMGIVFLGKRKFYDQ